MYLKTLVTNSQKIQDEPAELDQLATKGGTNFSRIFLSMVEGYLTPLESLNSLDKFIPSPFANKINCNNVVVLKKRKFSVESIGPY